MNWTKPIIDLNRRQIGVNERTVLVRNHTIPITVKKRYTDVDGVMIAKNTIPAAMQTKTPVFLMGEFDRIGGYKIGLKTVVPVSALKYVITFVNGSGAGVHSVVGFSGLADIGNELQIGDIVQVWTDSLINPSVFEWIIVQNNYASIASIIGNLQTSQNDKRIGPVLIHEINYFSDDDNQFNNALFFINYSNIGTFRSNSIDPLGMYRTPADAQENLVRIPLKPLFLDQYTGIAFNMIFDADDLHLDFKVVTNT